MGVDDPRQMHEHFAKYFNSKDADGILSLYEDDAVILAAPGQPAAGHDAIREALGGFIAMGGTVTFVAEAEPIINGDLALTHGRWRLDVEGAEPMESATAEVLRRGADGKWRYVLDNPWGTSILDA
jgi:uncharacterized protein (TIGR02246 family)